MSEARLSNFLLENKKRGVLAEKIAIEDYIQNGFKIIRTRIGSDFIASKTIRGGLWEEYVEVKTGKSRISNSQKIVMRNAKKSGKTYTIYRVSNVFMDYYAKSRGENGEIPFKRNKE